MQRLRVEGLLGPEGHIHPGGPRHLPPNEPPAPVVVWDHRGGVARVVVSCPRAEELGICPGMPLAEALALAGPQLVQWQARDPHTDRQYLQALGYFCQQFSPHVAVGPEEVHAALFLDVTGTTRYFGSEEALCRKVARALHQLGLRFRLAVADTPTGAWAVAFYGKSLFPSRPGAEDDALEIVPPGKTTEALCPLPVGALRLDSPTLELLSRLGIHTVEQLLKIPPEELRYRLGPGIWRRWQEATGQVPEVLPFLPPPHHLRRTFLPEFPLGDYPSVLQAIEDLLEPLLGELEARNQGVIALSCRLARECPRDTKPRESVLEFLFSRPVLCKKHILSVIELRLETMRWHGTIRGVTLEVLQFGPVEGFQHCLVFGDTPGSEYSPRPVGELLDRLRARLGPQAVCSPVLTGEVNPDRSWIPGPPLSGFGPSLPLPKRFPQARYPHKEPNMSARGYTSEDSEFFRPRRLPRPTTLLKEPIPIATIAISPWGAPIQFVLKGKPYQLTRSWGPERIETGWWRGEIIRRDYFRSETTTGHRFWLFRELDTGQWFLHGIFD